ncbi:MAG: biopolymer transporter ExbD [Pseudomonadota bacterium]
MKRVSRRGSLLLLAALSSLALAGCAQGGDPDAPESAATVQPTVNTLTIVGSGSLRWNDTDITLDELAELLEQTRQMPTEPELQFRPSAGASYEKSAEILRVIKQSGITKFGFVGKEKYPVTEPAED